MALSLACACGIAWGQAYPAQPVGAALDIAPTADGGVPGFEFTVWIGLPAPAGTPKPIVDRLKAEMVKILRDRQAGQGGQIIGRQARLTVVGSQ